MNICFYLPPFRDRDFWPMARTLLSLGHSVFYGIKPDSSFAEIEARDRERPFDLVISSDQASRDPAGGHLHDRLATRPPLLEVVFNGLVEISENHRGADGSFAHLAEKRIRLGLMDPDLLRLSTHVGVPHPLLLPYGIPRFSIVDPGFFVWRLGRRARGVIEPSEANGERLTQRLTNRLTHRLRGYSAKQKSMDIVFLGECNFAKNRELLESIRARFFARRTFEELSTLDDEARAMTTIPPTIELTKRVAERLDAGDEAAARLGVALLVDHFVHQMRTGRRLHYLRELQASLGRHLCLYGDDFRRFGLDARSTSHGATEMKYLRSKIGIDFGSNSFAASLYTRSVRIIYSDAALVQLRQPDADSIFGSLVSQMTFRDGAEMADLLSTLLRSDARRRSLLAAEQALAAGVGGMEQTLTAALSEMVASQPGDSSREPLATSLIDRG